MKNSKQFKPDKRQDLVDQFDDDQLLFADGFDDCILGVCLRFGQEPLVAYDLPCVMAALVAQGMTEEEAGEWFEYNTIGAWGGERTPVWIEPAWTKKDPPGEPEGP